MELRDIVYKLTGPIVPVGETHADDARFENLKKLCELVGQLTEDIALVAYRHDSQLFSVQRSGKYARDFLDNALRVVE